MFDISWGEIAVVSGLGLFLVGKKDLPAASRMVGTQLGRVVGLLQGARARADRFAANNELKQLQNELRSGLRELDSVKAEMALSMSPSRGVVGRAPGQAIPSAHQSNEPIKPIVPMKAETSESNMAPISFIPQDTTSLPSLAPNDSVSSSAPELPPESQTIAAVAEEEWKRQGIDFSSQAERGSGMNMDVAKSGSATLSFLLQESLVFSQYDRVVLEQEQALQSKVDKVRDQRQKETDSPNKSG